MLYVSLHHYLSSPHFSNQPPSPHTLTHTHTCTKTHTHTHAQLRSKQDDERKRLLAAKDSLCSAMGIGVLKLQGPTHLDPSACTGMTDKTGYLGKRPENALRITRRPWPKRFCTVSMQGFTLAHSHVSVASTSTVVHGHIRA